ncbi:MAG TPA: prolyl oligopeptidase family serine peptidase [Methylomirabilota bacterium]|nr:prolyl oligopeptidase family serine peptidase [Methylomirabilota bacterium]
MNRIRWCALALVLSLVCVFQTAAQDIFTIQQALGAPFVSDLVAARVANRIAWTVNQEGRRNIYVAEGPNFAARQLTTYSADDGAELSELHFTADGEAIVYVRGEGKDHQGDYANPTSNPAGAEQDVWVVAFSGGAPKKIDAGNSPVVSTQGRVAYQRGGQIWLASLKTEEKPRQIVVRGKNTPVAWSPEDSRLLFVSSREDHSFIGIYDAASATVKFFAPSVDSDSDPVWSLDGKHVAFVRQPAVRRDTPDGYFIEPDRPHPWAIWLGNAETMTAKEIWQSGAALQDSYPYMARDTGGGVLNWAAENRVVFASEADGWQHLYALPVDGGAAKLLTPGNCEVEQWSFSADRKTVLFNSNCEDVDRRHIWRVNVNGSEPQELTSNKTAGIEWNPVGLSDDSAFAYLASDVKERGVVRVGGMARGGASTAISGQATSPAFPAAALVTPKQVIFKSGDGLELHGQLFVPANLRASEKRPALIFLHGGPMRQMLLGWHYMYYYSNCYAMNQFLANRGYVVLALNYRSGIGYGRAFREAPGRAGRGATEYQDVVAAGKYLQSLPEVDGARIGLWGGSYGGYLTALGLGRNSDLFAAGVDLHGVHDWPTDNWEGKNIPPELVKLAHNSSPITAVDTWKSPVLFIHGDDDRNVMFSQTVDLVARLRTKNVEIEQLVFPDDVHDFLLYRDWLAAYLAASDFFDRKLGSAKK